MVPYVPNYSCYAGHETCGNMGRAPVAVRALACADSNRSTDPDYVSYPTPFIVYLCLDSATFTSHNGSEASLALVVCISTSGYET